MNIKRIEQYFIEHPIWAFGANIFTIVDAVRRLVKGNFVNSIKEVSPYVVLVFLMTILLYYGLKILKSTKEIFDKSTDRMLCLSFSIYKKSCEAHGSFPAPNDWMWKFTRYFEKKEILRLYQLQKFSNEELGEMLAANIVTQDDLDVKLVRKR